MKQAATAPLTALILLPAKDDDPVVLGKSVSMRQLEFALEAGADRVVLLGDGASEHAVALSHRAEEAGAKVLTVTSPHALAPRARTGGHTLVMQRSVLPVSRDVLGALKGRAGIVVCPAGVGNELGYERIDLARSWAGALVIEDRYLPRLLDLPEDFATAPALLRVALQSGAAEILIGETAMADGTWSLVERASDAEAIEEKWLSSGGRGGTLSERAGRWIASQAIARTPVDRRHVVGTAGLAAFAGVLGVIAASQSLVTTSFVAMAIAFLLLASGRALDGLRNIPFGQSTSFGWISLAGDIALALCAGIAIEGDIWARAFPPLVLLAVLRMKPREGRGWLHQLRDRMAISLLLAAFAMIGRTEEGVMLAALVLLLAQLTFSPTKRG